MNGKRNALSNIYTRLKYRDENNVSPCSYMRQSQQAPFTSVQQVHLYTLHGCAKYCNNRALNFKSALKAYKVDHVLMECKVCLKSITSIRVYVFCKIV